MSRNERRRILVNADDFGHTRGINTGIVRAHREGIVSSTTLMVNRPYAEEAAAIARETPTLGVGLHVTLTGAPPGERPSVSASEVPSLVDEGGRLPRRPEGLVHARKEEVEVEVRAQLLRFHSLVGQRPTHLDSHHHAHRQPAVLEAFIAVARSESLPVRAASVDVATVLAEAGVSTTGFFVEDFYSASSANVTAITPSALMAILTTVPAGAFEVMCHPGFVDDELRNGSTYVEAREVELQTLTDPTIVAYVRDNFEVLRPGQF